VLDCAIMYILLLSVGYVVRYRNVDSLFVLVFVHMDDFSVTS